MVKFCAFPISHVSQQVGYDFTNDISSDDRYQLTESTGVNWLTNVQCDGYETTLSQCRHPPWGEYEYCTHVRVHCLSGMYLLSGDKGADYLTPP